MVMLHAQKYDLAVFIGRFQPFHNGHKAVVDEALRIAKNLLVLCGSDSLQRTYYNPFTFYERHNMICDSFSPPDSERVLVGSIKDFPYNEDEWIEQVQNYVANIAKAYNSKSICLIGHSKDNSSYYLKMFPEWESVAVENHGGLSATPMRETYFKEGLDSLWITKNGPTFRNNLPKGSVNFLEKFAGTKEFKELQEEFTFIEKYGEQWGRGPFNTVDACVIQAGHVLMIRRGGRPGKGLLALPGGFLNKDETLKDGMLRELREETKIDVPPGVLEGGIIHSEVFDDPKRDPRARIITQAYLISLPKRATLPKVKGADDAVEAMWVPLAQLDEAECFSDHYHMIQRLRGFLAKKPR